MGGGVNVDATFCGYNTIGDKMIDIPCNSYRVESDPEVEKLAGVVVEELKTNDEVTIYRHSINETYGRMHADKCIAMEVGKLFAKAGYYVSMYINDGGYFGWLEISKKPQDHSFGCVEIK